MITNIHVSDALRIAGRFADVTSLLSNIVNNVPGTLVQVDPYVTHHNYMQCWVDGQDVRREANLLFKRICDGDDRNVNLVLNYENYKNLFQYVRSHTNTLLHNHAVKASYGIHEDIDDEIRVWSILENLLCNISFDNISFDTWDIPTAWWKYY